MRRLLALFLLCAGALAQGIIIDRREVAPGRVRLQSHTARIQIRDQVAEVDLVQVFFNTGTPELEGIYLFPLPENAAVTRFTMTMDGKEVAGEILDANRAREIYRSIKTIGLIFSI